MQLRNLTRQTLLASNLEVADTAAKRNKGLLGRKGLAAGGGLWITPCESVHTIGMQFSIDLIYLDRKHRVRKVRSAVPPWRLSACLVAHSILELPAGTIAASMTAQGDQLEITDLPQQVYEPSSSVSRESAKDRSTLSFLDAAPTQLQGQRT